MKKFLFLTTIYIFLNTICYSQEVLVPVDVQYSFLNKSLDYIKNFEQQAQLKIGIIYQSKNNYSLTIQEQLKKLIQESRQQTVLRDPYIFDLSEDNNLESRINSVDILYITPLRAINIHELGALCQKAGILTIMATPQSKGDGIIMGFDLENNKAKIVIDMQAARQSNIEIKASLLKYARLLN